MSDYSFFQKAGIHVIIETTRFGKLDISGHNIIVFAAGIPGFKEYTKYIIIEIENSPFKYLQSIEAEELAFIIVSPFDFFPDYEFDLNDSIVHELNIINESEVEVWNIVTVPDTLEQATVNLLAPIIRNKRNDKAVQYIVQDSRYEIRRRLFDKEELLLKEDRS